MSNHPPNSSLLARLSRRSLALLPLVAINLLVFSSNTAAQSLSPAPATQVSLGPLLGGGTTTGSKVTSTSGYMAAVSHAFELTPGLSIAPRLELGDTQIATKQYSTTGPGVRTLGTYDNRIVAAGFGLSHPVFTGTWWAQTPYLTLMVGRTFTKLDVASNSPTQAVDTHYQAINGTYASSELGTSIPFSSNTAIGFAVVPTWYDEDQSRAFGTYSQGSVNQNGALTLGDGPAASAGSPLPNRAILRTLALKLSFSVGF